MRSTSFFQKNLRQVFKLVVAITISLSAGVIGSVFTASAILSWYETLIKPALNPPSWIFGPVWTILYILMGIASFLIWRLGWNRKDVRRALSIFSIQLIINALWSIIFFGLHSPGWALVCIAVLWLSIIWTMFAFYKIHKPAMYILIPYILWVSFASYLNYAIWTLN